MKVQFMEMIPNDSELYEKMFHSTYRKLAFQNGIYDFEKEMLVEFSPEYFFTFKAPVELKLKGNEKMKDEVYQKLFVDVFGDPDVRKGELNFALEEKTHDKAQYYLKVLARAIAAEIYGKDFFVVVGEGNSGKGTNTDALFGAFGKFVDNINAGCLTKKLGDDAAKARSWMVAIKNTRIVVANEVSMDVSLDASVIKTLSSGGDAITARQNYANESTFRLQTTAICFVNDMPTIKGVDDATTNRLKYLETSYSYLEGELYEKQKKNKNVREADPALKSEWLKRKDVLEAFASLVVGAYERNKPVAPECVVKASREWTETDDWKEKFTGLFEATGNDSDEMTPKEVYKIAKDNGILASENKMSRMMTQIGFTTTSITRRGKRVRYYKGVKEMDDSRGWGGY
jgi:phage/plasmid-associated DNA primase